MSLTPNISSIRPWFATNIYFKKNPKSVGSISLAFLAAPAPTGSNLIARTEIIRCSEECGRGLSGITQRL